MLLFFTLTQLQDEMLNKFFQEELVEVGMEVKGIRKENNQSILRRIIQWFDD
jgi:hypothetical protein